MGLTGTHTYVGFGLGAIQAGLFLFEAFHANAFQRLVVAEVVPDVVRAVRQAGGTFRVNIAHRDGVEQAAVGPIEIEDPAVEADRERLVEALAGAHEIGTAIPSVAYYVSSEPGSLHRILARGLRRKVSTGGPPAVIYTAENHNRAAEILEARVLDEIPEGERHAVRSRVRFLNTVIGKMSGVITNAAEIQAQGLVPMTPGDRRAFLVEEFNRILIAKIDFGGETFQRCIAVFQEKTDLLPFEEAKLYGHNATHALATYTGAIRGVQRIAELRDVPGVLPFIRRAFLDESGAALIRKYRGIDPLFSEEGYTHYADDLIERMTNPYLRDTVERVGRDPARKLAWDDRLIGTMRVALHQGIEPRHYAFGAAAALATLDPGVLRDQESLDNRLDALWQPASPDAGERQRVLDLVRGGLGQVIHWRESGFPALDSTFDR